MSRADTLELLNALLEELAPLGEMTPGRPLRAAEWNELVSAIRTMANLAASRERTTDDYLEDRFARVDHEHLGRIGLEWFEPSTRALLDRNVNGAVEQQTTLKRARDEIAQVRTELDELRRQVGGLRGDFNGLRDSDTARIRDLDRVAMRVELLRNVESRVAAVDQRLAAIGTDLQDTLAFRNELRDPSGQPINVRAFADRIGSLETLRDRLRTANGEIVEIRDLESAVARLEEKTIDRADLDSAVLVRLRDAATVAQSGLVETVRGQVESRFDARLAGVDTEAAALRGQVTALRGDLSAQDARLGRHDAQIAAAETELTRLPALTMRVDQQQAQLTALDGRVQTTQTAVADLPDLRTALTGLRDEVDGLAGLRAAVPQLESRLVSVEQNGAAINGLVASVQQTVLRVAAIEQDLPALRQSLNDVAANAVRIAAVETRLQATEAELDNAGDLNARLGAVDRQMQTLLDQQASTIRRIDEISIRLPSFDVLNNRVTAVEAIAAEQRNTVARLNDALSSNLRVLDGRIGVVEGRLR